MLMADMLLRTKQKLLSWDSTIHNGGLIIRILIAALGGYLIASSASILLSFMLPFSADNAIVLASILSCPIYLATILWTFSTSSWQRALIGTLSCIFLFVSLSWLLARGLGT